MQRANIVNRRLNVGFAARAASLLRASCLYSRRTPAAVVFATVAAAAGCGSSGTDAGLPIPGAGSDLDAAVGAVPHDAAAPGTDGAAEACVPKTCVLLGAQCGTLSDECGGQLDCGGCQAPTSCGGAGVAQQCGCSAKSCAQVGASCGALDTGCGVVDCGSCTPPETCGGSGVDHQCGCSCALAHAGASCSAGACSIGTCDAGWGDCDGIADNGCETDVSKSYSHCGACNTPCDLPNAQSTCTGGVCQLVDCVSPHEDCDGNPSNGCEATLTADVRNCGACGHVCESILGNPACHEASCASIAGPVAPAPNQWMWQGQQSLIRLSNGTMCSARISIAARSTAICYAAADGELRCAGKVGDVDFGPDFVNAGMQNVDQILLGPGDNFLCAHASDQTVRCMGTGNTYGQFGNGDTQGSDTFVTYQVDMVAAMGTGTGAQLCVSTVFGAGVFCAGRTFGPTPVLLNSNPFAFRFWVSPSETVLVNPSDTIRACESRTDCRIRTDGTVVTSTATTVPESQGAVAASRVYADGPWVERYRWLDQMGRVWDWNWVLQAPTTSDATELGAFKNDLVLSISGDADSTLTCGVLANGAVTCDGSLVYSGQTISAPNAPPGSAHVGCLQ